MSAGISAAATSSITAGTSRSVTTSWIFGAAFAACSDLPAARSDRASAAWAASAPAEWGAVALGPLQRGHELRDPGGGATRFESGQRGLERLPQLRALRGAFELTREQAGMAPADLLERPPWREPGGDRHAHQVQHVGQLRLDRFPPRASASAQDVLGSEKAGDRRGEQEHDAEPPRRDRGRGERGHADDQSEPCLERDDLAGRTIEPGGGNARGKPARGVDADLGAKPRDARQQRAPAAGTSLAQLDRFGEPGGRGQRGEGGEDDRHGVWCGDVGRVSG